MKKLYYLLTIVLLAACTNQQTSKKTDKFRAEEPITVPMPCFAGIDTTKAGESIACGQSVYKLVNNQYVLRINPKFSPSPGKCHHITLDSLSGSLLTELIIYDKKNASLTNYCSDIIIRMENGPPVVTRHLHAVKGEFMIGYSDSSSENGLLNYRQSIFIKNLLFRDPKTGKKIEIKNELIWKVRDIGTPG